MTASGNVSNASARSGRIAAAIMLGFAIAYGAAGARIEYSFSSDPLGPTVFPIIMATVLGLCSLWWMLAPGEAEPWPAGALLLRKLAFVLIVAGAVALMENTGFIVTATIVGALTAFLFGATPLAALGIGLVQGAFWNLLFVCGLGTYLPVGRWVTELLPALARFHVCS